MLELNQSTANPCWGAGLWQALEVFCWAWPVDDWDPCPWGHIAAPCYVSECREVGHQARGFPWLFRWLFCPLHIACLKCSLRQCWLRSQGGGDRAFRMLSTATRRVGHPRCFITTVWPPPGASNELHMLIIYLHSP